MSTGRPCRAVQRSSAVFPLSPRCPLSVQSAATALRRKSDEVGGERIIDAAASVHFSDCDFAL